MYSGSLIHPHIKRKLLSTVGRSYEPPPCPSPGPSVGGGKGGEDSKQLSSLRLQPLTTLLGRRILAHVNTKARSDLGKRRGGNTPESHGSLRAEWEAGGATAHQIFSDGEGVPMAHLGPWSEVQLPLTVFPDSARSRMGVCTGLARWPQDP